ncbi:replication terminator protein [Anoxybacillus flavithermus]|uniref:Replication terminator protein n=1 Tax=Anoxybacillus flavithermus TaxID=33934 RepID=A0A094J258_9BACL|nr:replication terminator protein [Anoxybacillus flavithermus]
MLSENIIDLNNFADGAVAERFNQELQKVLENIADPNTDPKKPRKVTLTVTLKADEKRDLAMVSVTAKSTLVPATPIETKLVMDYDSKGRITGAELKSGIKGQTYIDEDGEISDDQGNKIVVLK